MNTDEIARATRKYWPAPHWEYEHKDTYFAMFKGYDPENVGEIYDSYEVAQAACDRLNLAEVLRLLREPSEDVVRVGYEAFEDGYVAVRPRWVAMIDELIAEVMEA